MDIKYETIKNGYITKEQAIAISGCDRNLKDSIFNEYKKYISNKSIYKVNSLLKVTYIYSII